MNNPSDAFFAAYSDDKKEVAPVVTSAPVVPVKAEPRLSQNNVYADEFFNQAEAQVTTAVEEEKLTPQETTWGQDLDNAVQGAKDTWNTVSGFASYLPEHLANEGVGGVAEDIVEGANVMAHGVNKGLAGIADFGLVPISALTIGITEASDYMFGTDLSEGTSMTMISRKFQQYYPDAEYLPEEQEGYFDDLVRITHTSLEFGTGVGLTKLSNSIAKTADDAAALSKETAFSLGSGAAYQAALETGATEGHAMVWSLIAPMSPMIVSAGMKPKKLGKAVWGGTKKVASSASELFLVKSLVAPIKRKGKGMLLAQKIELESDAAMWTETPYWRAARKYVLNTQEDMQSLDDRVASLQKLQDTVEKAIPQTDSMRKHDKQMTKVSKMINDHLEETTGTRPFKLTLEQRYGPELKRMNHEDGVNTITDSFRVIYGDEYNAQIQGNRTALHKYLTDNTDKFHGDMDSESTRGFTALFENYNKEITEMQGSIEALAVGGKNMDDIMSETGKLKAADRVEHAYPQDAVNESLRPAVKRTNTLIKEAYTLTLESLPKKLVIDTTPLVTSLTRVFENTGAFADPKNMPTYVRTLVNGLKEISNTSTGTGSVSRQLLDESDTLMITKKEVVKSKNTRKQEWIASKEGLDEAAETYKGDLKSINEQYAKDKLVLDQQGADADIAIKSNAQAKRGNTESRIPEVEDLNNIEPPTLTTVGEVAEAVTLVNKLSRDMYKSQRFEEYRVLRDVRAGLDATMEGLRDQDPAAYKRWTDGNAHYTNFVAKDINDSMAGKIVKDGDHYPELTSNQVFTGLFEDADDDTLIQFLNAFDGKRKDLAPFLKQLDINTSEAGPIVPRQANDEFNEMSQEAVGAVKDMIYSSLVRKLKDADIGTMRDPVERMRASEAVLTEFVTKHGSKLRLVPGFEGMEQDALKMLDNIGQYRDLHQRAEQVKSLGIIKNAVGPNATIGNIRRDDSTAGEIRDFLDNIHESMDTTGNLMAEKYPQILDLKGSHSENAARKIRQTLFNAYVDEFSEGSRIDYNGMLVGLEAKGGERARLVTVLGEKEVIKLEGIAQMAKALDEADISFTESLTNNSFIKSMENAGLPLGRVGSRLQQRAVFRPSTGFIAGSVAAGFIDRLAKSDTAKSLKILMDDPSKLTEIDTIIGDAIQKLQARKKAAVVAEMKDPYGNMSNIIHTLAVPLTKALYRQANHMGYSLTEEETKEVVMEVLSNDPRDGKKAKEVKGASAAPLAPIAAPIEKPVQEPQVKEEVQPQVAEEPQAAAPAITNVPEIPPSDPTSALSTRKSVGEIRDKISEKDITKKVQGLSAEERAAYMKRLNGAGQ
jgi:hypothetical protein